QGLAALAGGGLRLSPGGGRGGASAPPRQPGRRVPLGPHGAAPAADRGGGAADGRRGSLVPGLARPPPRLAARPRQDGRHGAVVLGLVFSAVPIYSACAAVATTPHLVAGTLVFTDPGGLTALADQELAGGIMWVPGSIPFSVGIFVFLYRWLDDGRPAVRAR